MASGKKKTQSSSQGWWWAEFTEHPGYESSEPASMVQQKAKSIASYHSTIDQYRHHESLYITIKFGQDLIFASLLFFLLLYPSLGVDVVGAGTGAGALNSALFPPAPPPPNYFRIFDHLASLFSDSHFLLSDPLLLAPFPPLPSRIFAIFTICSLASSSCNFRIFACFVVISLHVL
ncbi:uncharacterized protein EDB91DRAFT_1339536 [Suillus paluster]|uniref:uncharacterized protein n=1 Tax=Suillus paluster TaxID=48578 RepID=UPI001B876343|nr:uncharacterized protein EDB91DRAFT_1339536 [Suillus paluster]KAG1727095.1 hypothetical protein EDB91DRAFT_1339536 [Suillus paluster]